MACSVKPLIAMLTLFMVAVGHHASAEEPLTIAVAANLQTAYRDLASAFQQQTGIVTQASFGATGKLATQIRQGAPFHVLLAADNEYPQQLHQEGLGLQAPRVYASGALVIWTTRDLPLNDWQVVLQSPAVQHIAIADPKTAPYGREAARALQHYRLLRTVEAKLVYGESIGQTNQFIVTGAADIGFTAKSTVVGDKQPGTWREVPIESYAPILQSALLLRYAEQHERAAAERFYQFMFSPTAQTILQQYGYRLPAANTMSAPVKNPASTQNQHNE
jgi:molybdate transport system substrate-binding protein